MRSYDVVPSSLRLFFTMILFIFRLDFVLAGLFGLDTADGFWSALVVTVVAIRLRMMAPELDL